MLLDVILHLRNLAGCETIFVQDKYYGDVFTATGVFRISKFQIARYKLSTSVWVLVDSDTELTSVPEWVRRLGYFVVQAASPRPERLKWEKKNIGVFRYILKLWSLEEAVAVSVDVTLWSPKS